ncbi:MAG: DedA family protein [Patescibacteria group bacterium]
MDSYEIFALVAQYVGEYRWLGYWVVGIASFIEAIPFGGLVVPGNIILVAAGVLAYEGYLDIYDTIIIAIAGATLGDMVGYWLGTRYNGTRKLTDVEQQDKYPLKRSYLERTELFFERHGGKSVFWGRFIGPLRPFIAFIAGIGRMPFGKFMWWNTASAVVWASGFFFLGYVFEGSLRYLERIEYITAAVVAGTAISYAAWRYVKRKISNGQLPSGT